MTLYCILFYEFSSDAIALEKCQGNVREMSWCTTLFSGILLAYPLDTHVCTSLEYCLYQLLFGLVKPMLSSIIPSANHA